MVSYMRKVRVEFGTGGEVKFVEIAIISVVQIAVLVFVTVIIMN